MSDETESLDSSALMDADAFYESDPSLEEAATEAGGSPEVDEEVEAEEESDAEADTEAEAEPEGDEAVDSTPYQFDEESGEYTFKAGGKEVTANTDKLIEYAQKGVGFEKNLAKSKRQFEESQQEVKKTLESLNEKYGELQALTETVESLLQEESISDELLDDDPAEYIRREKAQKERQAKIEQAKLSYQHRQQADIQSKADREWKALLDAQGWTTDEDVKEGIKPAFEYMDSKGISRTEIYPAQAYIAFEKAAKYDALQAKKQEAVKQVRKAPKSVKSKTPSKPTKEMSDAEVIYGT